MALVVGVDGCRTGWLCVVSHRHRRLQLEAHILPTFADVVARFAATGCIAIDIPIGLPDRGARACDQAARGLLGPARRSSVFPAPVRAAVAAKTYPEACRLHRAADGRALSRQAFGILPKIREVDRVLARAPDRQRIVREVHPEVSFRVWAGRPMRHAKTTPAGRAERVGLIDRRWPGERRRLMQVLPVGPFRPDDVHDALAALWSGLRIVRGAAIILPETEERDRRGLRMEINA